MKSSKQSFDQVFKEKLQELTFEATAADTPDFLKKQAPKKKKLVKKTLGKLSMLLTVVGSFAFLQQKIQYKNEVLASSNTDQEPITYLNNSAQPFAPVKINLQESDLNNTVLPSQLIALNVVDPTQDETTWQQLKTKELLQKGRLSIFRFTAAPAISDIFEYEGAALIEQQTSTEKTVVCGLNKEKNKLVIARSRVASFDADTSANENEQGVYRPAELTDDAVIQYNVFDKQSLYRRFQAESIHWGKVRTTKIMKPTREKKVKAPKTQDPKTQVQKTKATKTQATNTKNKANKVVHDTYQQGSLTDMHQHSTRQYVEAQEEYSYFIQQENIIFISDHVNYVLLMQPDGTILSKAQIEISSPKMYYLGEKRAYYDQQTGKTYICMATLYHFYFYELEVANGQTTFLFKMDSVWSNPNFKIDAGTLTYTFKGKQEAKAMN